MIPVREIETGAADWPGFSAFSEGLKDSGWQDGKNLRILWRAADGNHMTIPAPVSSCEPRRRDLASGAGLRYAANCNEVDPDRGPGAYAIVAEGYASRSRIRRQRDRHRDGSRQSHGKMLSLLKEASPRKKRVAVVGQAAIGPRASIP
jgi:hypothetical protein